jgi:hypothetical protein
MHVFHEESLSGHWASLADIPFAEEKNYGGPLSG